MNLQMCCSLHQAEQQLWNTINTRITCTVCLKLYRPPHAYREMVELELKEMLDSGISEPSASQQSEVMVLVKVP